MTSIDRVNLNIVYDHHVLLIHCRTLGPNQTWSQLVST